MMQPRDGEEELAVGLTRRCNFRKTFTGKCVLQLEEDVRAWWPRKRMKRRWRNANLMDLAGPELCPLATCARSRTATPRAITTKNSTSATRPCHRKALAGDGRIATH